MSISRPTNRDVAKKRIKLKATSGRRCEKHTLQHNATSARKTASTRKEKEKGKVAGGEKGKGKGKRKGKGGRKGGGKGSKRRRWGPRKKGNPKRSQSRTRGYANNRSGQKLYPSKVPFKKEHLNDKCTKCNHKTRAGDPVAPHRVGDLICPEVQAGRVMAHPRWSEFKDSYKNVRFYKPGGASSSTSTSGPPTFKKTASKPKSKSKGFGKGDKVEVTDKKTPFKMIGNRLGVNMVGANAQEDEWQDASDSNGDFESVSTTRAVL